MTGAKPFPTALLGIWTTAVVVFVITPLIVVVLVSLTPLDFISLPRMHFSLRWYAILSAHPEFLSAAINSILLAVEAAAVALLLGVTASLAVVRYSFVGRGFVRIVSTSPLFVPMVMTGLALLMFTSNMGMLNQHLRLLFGHIALTVPYVMRATSASLTGFDMNQELAARSLGASPLRAFFKVTLPQVAPGLFAGTTFALIMSFDNVGLSIFLTGAQFKTLPVELYSHVTYENDPMSASVSALMILFSILCIVLLERTFGLRRLMA